MSVRARPGADSQRAITSLCTITSTDNSGQWQVWGRWQCPTWRIESLTLRCDWEDQGWGNRKGRVRVALLRPDGTRVCEEDVFGLCGEGDRSIAQRVERRFGSQDALLSSAGPGDAFQFEYYVGEGGGHELVLSGFQAEAFGYSSEGPDVVQEASRPELPGQVDAGEEAVPTAVADQGVPNGVASEDLPADGAERSWRLRVPQMPRPDFSGVAEKVEKLKGPSVEDCTSWGSDNPFKCCCGCFWCSAIILIVVIPLATSNKQLGQFKYGLLMDSVSKHFDASRVYTPGRYWTKPTSTFVEYPSVLQSLEFSNSTRLGSLKIRDMTGKQFWLDVSAQYLLQKDSLFALYAEVKNNYHTVFVTRLRNSLMETGNNFLVNELWDNITKVQLLLDTACQAAFSPHAQCWGLQILSLGLDSLYNAALTRTQVRKQQLETQRAQTLSAAVRAQTQVMLAELRRNVSVVNATGQAEVYRIQTEATSAAQAMLVALDAKYLSIVQRSVKLPGSNVTMTGEQFRIYQRLSAMQNLKQQMFIYNLGSRKLQDQRAI